MDDKIQVRVAPEFEENENQKPSLAYCMALILRVEPGDDLSRHRTIVRALLREGLSVAFLDETEDSDNSMVVLVDACGVRTEEYEEDEASNLYQESARELLMKERTDAAQSVLRKLAGVDVPLVSIQDLNESEELLLTNRIVHRALDKINIDKEGVLRPFYLIYGGKRTTPYEDVVRDILPLHDMVWNKSFYSGLTYNAERDGKSWEAYFTFLYKTWLEQHPTFIKVEDLRCHFGDRLSTAIEFVLFYRKWVFWLACFTTLHYVLVRFISWGVYVFNLFLIGVSICCYWGPSFAHHWDQRYIYLSQMWKERHILLPPAHTPNPYQNRKLETYDSRSLLIRRRKVNILTGFIVLINIIILVPVSLIFTQWYVYGKMAPSCKCCDFFLESGIGNGTVEPMDLNRTEWVSSCYKEYMPLIDEYPIRVSLQVDECKQYLNCFSSDVSTVGTDRWLYILLQGVFMGLILDVFQTSIFRVITTAVTRMEGHEFLESFNKSLIRKRFFFIWVNMFFWYLSITFVYVPFGEKVQIWLEDLGYGVIVSPWGWRPNKIRLDEAFVTPVIVTAFVNAVLDTFVPMLVGKLKMKLDDNRRDVRRLLAKNKEKLASSAQKIADTGEALTQAVKRAARNSVTRKRPMLSRTKPRVNETNGSMLSRKLAASRNLISSPTTQLFHMVAKGVPDSVLENVSFFGTTPDLNNMDSTDVLRQTYMSPFEENDEYLFVVIQLGYISMFSSAWGLLPFAAVCRLIFSFRSICFKVFFASRRSLPIGSPDIQEWIRCVYTTFLLAIPVISAQFSLATGSFDFVVVYTGFLDSNCTETLTEFEMMIPGCDEISITARVILLFVLEHLLMGCFLVAFIQASYWRKKTYSMKEDLTSLTIEGHDEDLDESLVPNLPEFLVDILMNYLKDESDGLDDNNIKELFQSLLQDQVPETTLNDITFTAIHCLQQPGETPPALISPVHVLKVIDHIYSDPLIKPYFSKNPRWSKSKV